MVHSATVTRETRSQESRQFHVSNLTSSLTIVFRTSVEQLPLVVNLPGADGRANAKSFSEAARHASRRGNRDPKREKIAFGKASPTQDSALGAPTRPVVALE